MTTPQGVEALIALTQRLRRLGSVFVSLPASRGIDDCEEAGEAMLEAAATLDALDPAGLREIECPPDPDVVERAMRNEPTVWVEPEAIEWLTARGPGAYNRTELYRSATTDATMPLYTHPAAPVQEPVAWQIRHPAIRDNEWYEVRRDRFERATREPGFEGRELYTHPSAPAQQEQP